MTYVLMTEAVCSECTAQRARDVVARLQAAGWDIEYGGEGRGSVLPSGARFCADFYDAIDGRPAKMLQGPVRD